MSTSSVAAELWARCPARVGESPLYDPRTDSVLWVDIPRGRAFTARRADATSRVLSELEQDLSAVMIDPAGAYLAATAEGFGTIDRDGRYCTSAVLLPDADERMNDAKLDACGRLWSGSTERGFRAGRGRLWSWRPGETPQVHLSGLTLPNGLGWSPDNRRMYLVDSLQRVVLAADYELDTGRPGRFQPWLTVPSGAGLPDGLCVDAEGDVWIALWGAGRIDRHSPAGRRVGSVRVPVSRPTSCAFGPDGDLYVTSEHSDGEPLSGSVFVVATDARGTIVGPSIPDRPGS